MTNPLYYNQPVIPQNLTQPAQQPKGLNWVNGEAGANGFFVTASNSPIVLFDADNPVIYIKSVDNYGRPTMQVLDYTIRNAQPAIPQQPVKEVTVQETNFVTKDDFEKFTASITALIDEKFSYRKPNKPYNKPKEDKSNE